MFSKKGQGSLEYLLLIGGAVLVAAIVIALVISSGTGSGDVTKQRANCLNAKVQIGNANTCTPLNEINRFIQTQAGGGQVKFTHCKNAGGTFTCGVSITPPLITCDTVVTVC